MDPQVELRSRPSYSFTKDNGFNIHSITALKLLCAGIEALVKLSESVAPVSSILCDNPSNTHGQEVGAEAVARKNFKNEVTGINTQQTVLISGNGSESTHENSNKTISNSLSITKPYVVVREITETSNAQSSAIIRKFYSKSLPPINLVDYLMRIHKFCPMPTAVYLATSSYIHKLATEEKAISVTRCNCHRLVLAGLRVTMKAFEDEAYSHSRFSKVGGVTSGELARLEINFCFLINFDFIISGEALLKHAMDLKIISSLQGSVDFNPGILSKLRDRSSFGAKEVTADA